MGSPDLRDPLAIADPAFPLNRGYGRCPLPFVNGHDNQLAMRELIALPRVRFQVMAALSVGLAFGVMAPFGTAGAPTVPARFLYWLLAIALNWLQISLTLELVRRSALTRAWTPLRQALTVAAAVSLPASFEIIWLNHYFLGTIVATLTGLAEIYLYVLLVSVMITVPANLLLARKAAAAPAGAPAFLDRVPAVLGRDLIGLEMEDHYLRIHTTLGSDLILCRFSDALRELEHFDGLQVHRSWYVARAAIKETRKDGQKMTLTLSNGIEVPVSRPFQKAVRSGI